MTLAESIGRRRANRVVAVGVLVVVVGTLGFWAGRTALDPPSDPVDDTVRPEVYVVADGEVGRTVPFVATAEWPREPLASSPSGGTITSIDAATDAEVGEGDVIYTLDLRPVVAMVGDVPMFRELRAGASGRDVAQIQAGLGRLGMFDATPDGVFGASTVRGVRAWQRSIGVDDDGVVRANDVVFAPRLPTRMAMSDGLGVGSRVAPGQDVLSGLAASPTFALVLPPDQGRMVEPGMAVEVAHPGGIWEAEIALVAPTADGREIAAHLEGPMDGQSVCGDECSDVVPLNGQTTFRTEVVLTPATSGPVVPVAAIATTAGGRSVVMGSAGQEIPVEIIAGADGLAVVSGLEAGTEILVPFPTTPIDATG